MRVLVTGASGCIGHAIVAALLDRTPHRLVLSVRDATRLAARLRGHARVELVTGDLRTVSSNAVVLASVDAAVLAATSWGEDALAVNLDATAALVSRLDPERCRRVVYFSTASILSSDLSLLPQAESLGTPYIASKVACTRALLSRRGGPPITAIYPTLVIGGGAGAPVSHFARLVQQVAQHESLLRFATATGSFHLVHAEDIASVVAWLIDAGEEAAPREIVVGGAPVSVDEAIDCVLRLRGRKRLARVDVGGQAADTLIRIFRVQLAPWDRYCLEQRHFRYRDAVTPARFGLPVRYPTLESILRAALDAG